MRQIKFRVLTQGGSWMEFGVYNGIACNPAYLLEDTTSQYTGLKDKNGKEIYEGDILMSNGGSKWKIDNQLENNCGECGWVFGWEMFDNARDIEESHEVIGNIYENPELLEK